MPDHHRAKKNSLGHSSPDSPLSLVVHEDRINDSKDHGNSPGRSSGYSEGSEDHHHQSSRVSSDEELPLSLVIREVGEGESDSGHEDDRRSLEEPDVTIVKVPSPNHSSQEKSGIKIKDFAKLLCDRGEDNAVVSDEASEISSGDNQGSRWKSTSAPHLCEFCDKTFINKYHLQSHLVTHTGERSFECRKCHKTFGRKSTLRAHMTTHTKVSNFMCPVCDKACNDNNSLEEHIRMHTGEKPFVCSICSKAYARKSHLNVHYRVHTGERPFVCLNCRKDFTEKRFLNDHIQTAHSGQEGPLKCPNCFREFAYKTSLKQHLKKQMCVKNLSRTGGFNIPNGINNSSSSTFSFNNNNNIGGGGGGTSSFCGSPPATNNGGGNGTHTKQFSCPFCEKSYSWKQTLKQHVSMYHRNKVHTDEFWKYELTKHRRSVVDSKTNEDMWKKQLGRHGKEEKAEGEISNKNNSETWLEQIKQTSDPSNSALSTEMKLLALQSLQSSLQLMRMQGDGSSTEARGPSPQQQKQEPQQPGGGDNGYLSLLAHISSAQRRVIESDEKNNNSVPRSDSPALPEEPAVKRTQMWLAQLGRYRQRSLQEEMDKNHDELWEEQIAKIKQNPVRSPLEPVEITIDDDDEEEEEELENEDRSGGRSEMAEGAKIEEDRDERRRKTDEEEEEEEEDKSSLGPALLPPPPPTRKMVPLMSALEVQAARRVDDDEEQISDGSVLKSILLDRFGRKRPSLDPPAVPAKVNVEESTDILRRRLLGLKEEPILVVDVERDPLPGEENPPLQPKAESLPPPPSRNESSSSPRPERESAFARTSVLKHLLHRYTESHSPL